MVANNCNHQSQLCSCVSTLKCKHMHKCFIGLPTPFDAGLLPLSKQRHRASPIDTSSVTRVQPRASKGMTDLLLPPVSYDLCISVVNPSKKIHLRGAPHREQPQHCQRQRAETQREHQGSLDIRAPQGLHGITASTTCELLAHYVH